ncbi:MAG: CheB methylesterase domain-containing protein [Pseudomonadota bacterium]
MTRTPAPSCFLVVQASRSRAVQMMSDLRAACPGSDLRHAIDLTEAHDLSQKEQPDLVVLDEDFIQEAGLAVFLSLLSALAIDWIIAYKAAPHKRLPSQRQIRVGALTSFIENDWRPRRSQPTGFAPDANAQRRAGAPQAAPSMPARSQWKIVVAGASTGGIEALIEMLSHFPENAPPTVIVQHINGSFIPGLADRLDRLCAPSVRAARNKDLLRPGHIFLAPGNTQHLVISEDGRMCQMQDGPAQLGHRPSVDVLFSSAARGLGSNAVGVLLSGMGRDGARGLLDIRHRGGWTIGQDKDTCVVYGMPRAAEETGAVQEELPLQQIGPAVLKAALKPASQPAQAPRTPPSRSAPNHQDTREKKTHNV